MTAEPFIGRDNELDLLLDAVKHCANGVVWDITGTNGIGKTSLLRRLADSAADGMSDRNRLVVVSSDLEDLDPADSLTGYGAEISAELLWYTFRQTFRVLSGTVQGLPVRFRSAFDDFIARAPQLMAESQAFVEQHDLRRSDGADRQFVEQILRIGIREQQRQLDDLFVEAWSELTAGRTALVLLDHFEVVANDEFGHWLVRLALRLPSTLTVLARVRADVKLGADSTRYHQRELPLFTREQVGQYLSQRLDRPLPDDVAAAVDEYIQGHVGGLVLAGTLLAQAPSVDAASVRDLFGRRPQDPDRAWARLVTALLGQVYDPALKRAVDAATVLRTFDRSLLARLVGDDVAEQAIRTLSGLGLIRRLDGGTARFRMIEFVRQAAADELRELRSPVWLEMHEAAATYYFELLGEDLAEENLFGRGFKYEDAVWQTLMRDWLYHSGQLPQQRELTRARFAQVFFEAFYWWGCFHPFDFNHDLVDEWERTIAISSGDDRSLALDRELTQSLRFLLAAYPEGLIKTPDAPWREIEDTVLRIRTLCGLGRGARPPKNAAARKDTDRTKGLLLLFGALSLRYQDPLDEMIDVQLTESIRLFADVDLWMVAWLHYEAASVAVDRQDRVAAVAALARSSEALIALSAEDSGTDDDAGDDVEHDWDYELIAEVHRALGDLEYEAGDHPAAAAAYGRAARNAYWLLGRPNPPDPYTQRYYTEMTEAVIDRIQRLADSDPDAAAAFALAVRRQLGRLSPGGDPAAAIAVGPAELRAVLLPRGPLPSEIGPANTEFAKEWTRNSEYDLVGPLGELHDLVALAPDG